MNNYNILSDLDSFAHDVKLIAYSMGWNGKKDKAGRKLLTAIGNFGREYNPDIWVNKTSNIMAMRSFNFEHEVCLVLDCRFVNEIEKMRFYFGKDKITSIRIVRDRYKGDDLDYVDHNDISETSLDNYKDFDYIIDNNNAIGDFYKSTRKVFEEVFDAYL